MKNTILSLLVAVGLIGSASAQDGTSETFGTGANQFTLDFTTIGNAGQAADPLTGYGAVGYNYRIGTYTISQNQIDAATANGLQGVTAGAWSGDQPAANISWYQAAAFVNWLDTSTGHQAAYNLTYSGGAYTMALWQLGDSGYDPSNPFRNSFALYVLPSENEFYKAAYGKNDGSGYYLYATASDSPPMSVSSGTLPNTAVYNGVASQPASVYQAGGLSSYGTMGQGGNVNQLLENSFGGSNNDPLEDRVIRGGDAVVRSTTRIGSTTRVQQGIIGIASDSYTGVQDNFTGFRLAEITSNLISVPEPSTYALFGTGAIGMLMVMRRKKTA